MVSHLCGHVIGPLDTSLIMIVENSWQGSVEERKFGLGDAMTEISEIDNLFGGGTHGTNLGFTRAERCAVLALSNPADQTAIAGNNATVNTSEFEKRHESALCQCISDLRSQQALL